MGMFATNAPATGSRFTQPVRSSGAPAVGQFAVRYVPVLQVDRMVTPARSSTRWRALGSDSASEIGLNTTPSPERYRLLSPKLSNVSQGLSTSASSLVKLNASRSPLFHTMTRYPRAWTTVAP